MDRWERRAAILFVGLCLGAVATYVLMGFDWPSTAAATGCIDNCLNQLDLVAQRTMADAAWAMVIVSVTGTAIGGVSLWLIRENLVEARKLTGDAARSAKAAEEAVAQAQLTNQTTAELGRAQVRAYMTITGIELIRGSSIFVRIAYANAGQSPARLVNIDFEVQLTGARETTIYRDVFKRYLPDAPSGNAVPIDDLPINLDAYADDLPETLADLSLVTVSGQLTYSDVFEHRHTELFRFFGGIPTAVGESRHLRRSPKPSMSLKHDPVVTRAGASPV